MPLVHSIPPASRRRRLSRVPSRLVALVAIAFAVTSVGVLSVPRPVYAWDAGAYSSSSEKKLVSLTNQSRASAGLKALKVDSALTSIARWRSKDMITRGYFSHNIPPSGKNVFSVLDSKGYCYAIAGENIGWNNYPDDVATGAVHSSFMKSSGHRANILGKKWDVIGIGAYKGPSGKKMWTVIFADKCGKSSGGSGGGSSGGSGGGGGGGGSKTTPKPKPKATPRPTPKPTPKPTPVKTMPPEPTDPPGLVLGPGAPYPNSGTSPPGPSRPPLGVAGDESHGLRVVDPGPAGLLETIVGGVAGFYLGG